MKIGILTHHYVKNYGAFLQMKEMYETLQRLYPEAEVTVINYVNQKHWRRNILHRTMTIFCESLHLVEHLLSLQRMC